MAATAPHPLFSFFSIVSYFSPTLTYLRTQIFKTWKRSVYVHGMAGVPRGRPNDYRTNCRSERNGTERPRITQAPPTCQAAPPTAVSISLHTLIKHGCLSKDTVYKSFYTRCDKKLGGGVWERGYFSVHALGLLLLILSHYVPLVRIGIIHKHCCIVTIR